MKNNINASVDFIIVGQGIAGTTLALSLLKEGKSMMVVDKPELSASSRVAAGIWNPVVFKRLTQSWLADEIIPVLNEFYHEAEQTIHGSFLTHRKIAKLFGEEQEETFWLKKSHGDMKAYLSDHIFEIHHPVESHAAFVLQAGNIDTEIYLHKAKVYFVNHNSYMEEVFDHSVLQQSTENIIYKGTEAKGIIFCEGYKIKDNPFFKHIPMKPAKGDVLTIHCDELHIEYVLNKNFFIMPLGSGLFKVGATYNWEDLDDTPNPLGRAELEEKFKKLVPYEYQVVKHEAGVRPSVVDRRPVIGAHPQHKNIFLFNGFGTKAVMLAPYFAKHFVNVLAGKDELNKEVDCGRFLG